MSVPSSSLPTPLPHEDIAAFSAEVRAALQRGQRHTSPGLGTFTTCTRKAAPGRAACTIAMFRASAALRAQVAAGTATPTDGPHSPVVTAIVAAMQREQGVDVPGLGHLAVAASGTKKPRLVFRAAPELNAALGAGSSSSTERPPVAARD